MTSQLQPQPRPGELPAGNLVLKREREQQALGGVVSAATAGVGGLVIVRGAAGSGKTALLQAAQQLATQRAARAQRPRLAV